MTFKEILSFPFSPRGAFGLLTILVGLVWGGLSLAALSLSEAEGQSALGPLVTAVASVALVVAGVLLVSSHAAKKLATIALGLTVLAAAGYVFGFVVCLAEP